MVEITYSKSCGGLQQFLLFFPWKSTRGLSGNFLWKWHKTGYCHQISGRGRRCKFYGTPLPLSQKKIRTYMSIQQWFSETHDNPFYSCIFDSENTDCCSWSISKDNKFIFGGAFPIHILGNDSKIRKKS